VAPGVRCVPLNELARLAQPQAGYVVVGAGKTGMDACSWLLEQGVDPDHIRWIMPRDSWVLDRANIQSGDEFLVNTWGTMSQQLEAVVAAQDVPDLMLRLEAAGEWMRIDPRVMPTVYHGAILSRAELTQLRRIQGIVRLGHVKAIDADQIHLEQGSIELLPGTLVVDCSAAGIPSVETLPVWGGQPHHAAMAALLRHRLQRCLHRPCGGHVRRRSGEERVVHAAVAAHPGHRLAAHTGGEHEEPAALVQAPAASAVAGCVTVELDVPFRRAHPS
jgi:hypothetical protein